MTILLAQVTLGFFFSVFSSFFSYLNQQFLIMNLFLIEPVLMAVSYRAGHLTDKVTRKKLIKECVTFLIST